METSNGYVGMYNGMKKEFKAISLYDAKCQAIKFFTPSKKNEHMVHVYLVEKDGQQVTTYLD